MSKTLQRVPASHIIPRIIEIRGLRVIMDVELALIYGVTTSALNQAVKRNAARFPSDFRFQLTRAELKTLRSQIVISNRGGRRYSPYAFTEHGAVMAANVLRSPRALKMSIEVVRAFIRLRQLVISHAELAIRIKKLEKRYDKQFQVVFDALRELFDADEEDARKTPV